VTTLGRSRFSHIPDAPGTIPIQETAAAMGVVVSAGKARAIGVCNESPWGVLRWLGAYATAGLPRIVSVQNGYSLLDRQFELGLAEMIMREKLGLIAYSPLAGGTLTGKYGENHAPIAGSRSAQSSGFLGRLSDNKWRAISAYARIARDHGHDPAHMALAFARQQPFMASVLMAASSVSQLEANLGAIDLHLPKEVVQAINAVHDANPNPR
jgi:aryl-alcohol dehydrogenase-like predicted oxidoreductase